MPDSKVDYRIDEPSDEIEVTTPDSPEEGVLDGEQLPLEEHEMDPRSPEEQGMDQYRRAQEEIVRGTRKNPWPGTSGWDPSTWAPVNHGRKN